MTDIWGFLLQTLTASGAAVLLLIVKAMFRDKLSPRWQFAVWGVLGVVLLIPAGLGGRYVLFNWPVFVEICKSGITGDFGSLARVSAPVPVPDFVPPETAADWLYLAYVAGAGVLLARYALSYIRLRLALRKGRRVRGGRAGAVAAEYGLPVCPVVEVDGLPTAFVCGVFRPVLALPAGAETDDKVILHELLHLKHKDVAWGWVIAFFRCVHWCNPLLWLCAGWAANDLESLCDQRVLERLEGEDRRDYGRILLSMADEKYARVPGTSSAANGGKNIARRIRAIARFKRYPAGMGLASVCVAVVLAVPLIVGAQAQTVAQDDFWGRNYGFEGYMAAARTVRCTTCHGALDAYAKAILDGHLPYRAMCAPLCEQNELAAVPSGERFTYLREKYVLPGEPDPAEGYQIYNLTQVGEDAWEGLLMVRLYFAPAGAEAAEPYWWFAVQPLRAEKEGERWVVVPQGNFQAFQATGWMSMPSVCDALPARVYEARGAGFTVQVMRQTILRRQSGGELEDRWHFGTGAPLPDAEFYIQDWEQCRAVYAGGRSELDGDTHIAACGIPLWEGDERPAMEPPGLIDGGGSVSGGPTDGYAWGGTTVEGGEDWDGTVWFYGGGASNGGDRGFPDFYAVNLYLNGDLAAELTLLPVGDGAWVNISSPAEKISVAAAEGADR